MRSTDKRGGKNMENGTKDVTTMCIMKPNNIIYVATCAFPCCAGIETLSAPTDLLALNVISLRSITALAMLQNNMLSTAIESIKIHGWGAVKTILEDSTDGFNCLVQRDITPAPAHMSQLLSVSCLTITESKYAAMYIPSEQEDECVINGSSGSLEGGETSTSMTLR